MTKEELKTHIETRYSECSKRSQGLSYGSFYDGYMDCYTEFEKENEELNKKLSDAETDYDKMFWQKNDIINELKEDMEAAIPLLKKATVINEQLVKATKLLQEVKVYTENIDDEADALYDKIQQFLNENEVEG
jgi:predicted  nucleic acid-binding Zn-ribbon protein